MQSVSRRALARLLIALAVTPFAAGAVMFVTLLALWYSGVHILEGPPNDPVDVSIGLASGVTIIAVIVTSCGAVPAVIWLASRGPLSLGKVLLLGAVLGNVPFAVIVAAIVLAQFVNGTLSPDVGRLWYGFAGATRNIAFGLLTGTSSAAAFWLIAIRGTEAEHTRSRY